MNFCLWITCLPGSGKTTIAGETEKLLEKTGYGTLTLNLDQILKFLTPNASYTEEERELVCRSLVIMARLLVRHGIKNIIIDATGNRRKFR